MPDCLQLSVLGLLSWGYYISSLILFQLAHYPKDCLNCVVDRSKCESNFSNITATFSVSLHWWSLKHTQSFSAWIHIFVPGKGKINAFKVLTSLKWNYIIFHFFSSLQSLPGTHLLTPSVYLILKLTAFFLFDNYWWIHTYVCICTHKYMQLDDFVFTQRINNCRDRKN